MLYNPTWSAACASARPFADDIALVASLRAGDADAVAHVVAEYVPALHRYIAYQVQDAMLAEDLVSEVLTRMITKIDGYVQASTPFQAWLFRIARNLVADHYRARRRRPQISFEAWLSDDPAAEPGAADAAVLALPEREELLAGLAALTPEQRQVIVLHVVDGWELPEVARLLGRSVPSVKSLYYRGVQSLRRVLTRPPASRPAGLGAPVA